MKNIFKLMALFAFVFCFVSCDDDKKVEIPALPVTAANLNGTWQLSEWNGQALVEGTCCYITFNRVELILEMYRKPDGMYTRYITGSFNVKNDPCLEYVIGGGYDFGNGDWNNDYIVTDLLEPGSTIWTVKDNNSDANRYVCCEEVPESIVEEAKTNKN